MKQLILFVFLLAYAAGFSQTISLVKTDGDSITIGLDGLKYITDEGTHTLMVRGNGFEQYKIQDTFPDVVSRLGCSVLQFTDAKDGKVKAVNRDFVDRILRSSSGTALILTKQISFSFRASDNYADLIATCDGIDVPSPNYILPGAAPDSNSIAVWVTPDSSVFKVRQTGTDTITDATTVAITFPTSMPDANYQVQLTIEIAVGTPSGAELSYFVVAGKDEDGFTASLGEALEGGESVLVHWVAEEL